MSQSDKVKLNESKKWIYCLCFLAPIIISFHYSQQVLFWGSVINQCFHSMNIKKPAFDAVLLNYTCVGDVYPDTSVDVPARCGDDTPVLILIKVIQRGHRHSEDSCVLVIFNEDSVVRSVPGCFHYDATPVIYSSFAPVLCVFPKYRAVLTRDFHRSSMCTCYHLGSCWQQNWAHCMFAKPEQTKNWSGKMQTRLLFCAMKSHFYTAFCSLKKNKKHYHQSSQVLPPQSSWWEWKQQVRNRSIV